MSELKEQLAYHWWRLCHDLPDSKSVLEMSQNLDAAYWKRYERAAEHILLVIEIIGARLVTDLDRPHSLASTHKWFPPETTENAPAKAPPAQTAPPPPKTPAAPLRNRSPWKEGEINNLRRFMKEGKTAAQIADMFYRSEHAVKCAMWKVEHNRQIGRPK